MRKTILALPLMFSLGACATTGGTNTGPTVEQVQAFAVQVCGFLPTATTILNIFVANPALGTAEAIAEAICKAVVPVKNLQARRKRATVPMVGDVVIHGRFVR